MLLSLITCPTPLPLLHQFLNWYTRYVEDDERNSTKMGRLRAKLRRKKQFKKVRKQLVKLGPTEKAKAKFRRGVKLAFEDVKSQIRALGKSAELFELVEEGYDEHFAAKVPQSFRLHYFTHMFMLYFLTSISLLPPTIVLPHLLA